MKTYKCFFGFELYTSTEGPDPQQLVQLLVQLHHPQRHQRQSQHHPQRRKYRYRHYLRLEHRHSVSIFNCFEFFNTLQKCDEFRRNSEVLIVFILCYAPLFIHNLYPLQIPHKKALLASEYTPLKRVYSGFFADP